MKELTKGKPFKTILIFAIPLILANILSQTYNLVDLIIAGKVIGEDALSATGCSSTFIQFISSIFWGFGVALSTIVGIYFGQKNQKKIVLAIKTSLIFITIVMFFICLFCFLFSKQILILLGVDKQIFTDSNSYFKLFMIALFFQSLTYQMTCILQSIGNSKYPLLLTAISGLSNLILNILFVIVIPFGVKGLAYATIISSLIAFIFLTTKIRKTIFEFNGKFNFEFSKEILFEILHLAFPCILQQCSLYISSVVVQPLINKMGKTVSAGFSIAMNINLLFNAIYHGISRAVATYTSQSKGAKLYKNYSKGIKIGIIQQIILVTPLLILCFIFPDFIVSIFLKNNDKSCIEYAKQYIYVCLPFVFFVAYGNLMHSFYKSVEATKSVLLSTTIFSISRIILSYVIPNKDLIFSIYLALSLAWVIESIVLTIIYFSKLWNKDRFALTNSSKTS